MTRLEKLGAYVMQAGETTPVSWRGRTLLVQTVSGNTPGVYDCCNCTTFGCVDLAKATHIGYSDCSACQCSPERLKQVGSCAPEFFQIIDFSTLEVLVSPIPGTEGFAFASAFVQGDRLWVYGTNLVNHTRSDGLAGAVSCFSSSQPTSSEASAWDAKEVLVLPPGYNVFNTDVSAVDGRDASAPERRFILALETRAIAGKPTPSFVTMFAETSASTPDEAWTLVDPTSHAVSPTTRMAACPFVRYVQPYYYVATTTQDGSICPAAGWSNSSEGVLCVVVYRSASLREGDWTMGNGGRPILAPDADDRKLYRRWRRDLPSSVMRHRTRETSTTPTLTFATPMRASWPFTRALRTSSPTRISTLPASCGTKHPPNF